MRPASISVRCLCATSNLLHLLSSKANGLARTTCKTAAFPLLGYWIEYRSVFGVGFQDRSGAELWVIKTLSRLFASLVCEYWIGRFRQARWAYRTPRGPG